MVAPTAAFTADPPLVRGLSIGWNEIESVPVSKGVKRVLKWVWGELSAVTIPMNAGATILAVKAADMAASGLSQPGVTGALPVVSAVKAAPKTMTTQEQIVSFENTLKTKTGRMTAIMASYVSV